MKVRHIIWFLLFDQNKNIKKNYFYTKLLAERSENSSVAKSSGYFVFDADGTCIL